MSAVNLFICILDSLLIYITPPTIPLIPKCSIFPLTGSVHLAYSLKELYHLKSSFKDQGYTSIITSLVYRDIGYTDIFLYA
jgi:hypothetical protein